MFTFTQYDIALCMGAKKASGNIVMGLEDTNNPYIPELLPSFIPPAFVADIIAGVRLGQPIFIYGPTGCAKTESVRWICNKFHLPLLSVTGHARLDYDDLIGHHSIQDGTLTWVDGPLTFALRNGATFCFDEVTLCPPETLVGLHGILDRHPLIIAQTNEVVPVHPQFRMIFTDNTNGAGDETGMYLGTTRQNEALLNRCFFVKADYLQPAQEKSLLESHVQSKGYSLPEEIISGMVKFAEDCRSPKQDLQVSVSVRDLHRWADATYVYAFLSGQGKSPVLHALERSILFRYSEADQNALRVLARGIFNIA